MKAKVEGNGYSIGQSLVEFALVFPIILLAFFAAVDAIELVTMHSKIDEFAQSAALICASSGNASSTQLDQAIVTLASKNALQPANLQMQVGVAGHTPSQWYPVEIGSSFCSSSTITSVGDGIAVAARYNTPLSFGMPSLKSVSMVSQAFAVNLAYRGAALPS